MRISALWVLPIWGYAALQLVSTWAQKYPEGDWVLLVLVSLSLVARMILFVTLSKVVWSNRIVYYLDRAYDWSSEREEDFERWQRARTERTTYLIAKYRRTKVIADAEAPSVTWAAQRGIQPVGSTDHR